jgi:DNA-binding CsgD family transcriptional regulator
MGLPSLIRPVASGPSAVRPLVTELHEIARTRARNTNALWDAVGRATRGDLSESLNVVAEKLPLVVEADCTTLRLSDEEGMLHLVAASGWAPSEIRISAIAPVDVHLARGLDESEMRARYARARGFQWLEIRWLGGSKEPLGSVLLASRTDRRPEPAQLSTLDAITETLTEALTKLPGRGSYARARAVRLARSLELQGATEGSQGVVANLRRQERVVLGLYADGMTTRQVADFLVISEHTVRTHVKTALKTLGAHSRAEAIEVVRTAEVGLLL